MKNEEKSEELRKTALPNPLPDGYGMWLSAGDVDAVLIKMAKWKEQQMIDKACEWLKNNTVSSTNNVCAYTALSHNICKEDFIEEFREAMEEQL